MKYLSLFAPLLSAVLVILLLAENILFHYDEHLLFHYRYCSNMPISATDMSKFGDLFICRLFTCLSILSLMTELCCHIVIYMKKTTIESRTQGEVYEISGSQLVSQMRHQRNVVSIFGHTLTFVIILGRNLVFVITYYILTDEALLLRIQCFVHILDPCFVFCICPFIETLSSHTLLNNMFSFPRL